MKPDIKERWIAALESGKYKQGQGSMKAGDSFCCLGVLCDLYAREHNVDFYGLHWTGPLSNPFGTHRLPIEVERWSGLDDEFLTCDLAELNDTTSKFPIASIKAKA